MATRKKKKRFVLGEGYPWFIRVDGGKYGGVNMFKRAEKSIGERLPNLHLKIGDLRHQQRIRLVAEIISEGRTATRRSGNAKATEQGGR